MFKKLLIANRGEIACRIIKTAKKLNIRTIAVYSEIDAAAVHVAMADEAYCIGPAPSRESYLNGEKIVATALRAQAGAIHPGYGFLSEDAEFAQQCERAGLIFVGPSAHAIQVMGDKNLAKTTMAEAGVPVIPGYHGDQLEMPILKKEAKKIGFPLLIKASAGGGGKGMRLVQRITELEEAVNGARREAQAGFGDSRIFMEKYLTPSRHIELQILFDTQGQGVTLFNRDCSIQRRHQKVIEEAPASHLTEDTQKKMAKTALQAGAAIRYRGAGTIEFLVDAQENFYFMEMNTRLQVEHPVTEMITGLDLVEWQLRIAAGEPLTLQPSCIQAHGHAIEARLYAENPQNQFMPSAGPLLYFQLPQEIAGKIRIDTGFKQHDMISVYYDPLIAKIIAWGKDRLEAIERLKSALLQTAVFGIHTNLSLLNRIINNALFIEGKINTDFIPHQQEVLLSLPAAPPDPVIILVCLTLLDRETQQRRNWLQSSEDSFSPWSIPDGWRITGSAVCHELYFYHKKTNYLIRAEKSNGGIALQWNEKRILVQKEWKKEQERLATVLNNDPEFIVFYEGEPWRFSLKNPIDAADAGKGEYGLKAPMPGTVIEVYVKSGQSVEKGERLMVIEAMKMEHTIYAPHAGIIKTIVHQPGNRIQEGAELLQFE